MGEGLLSHTRNGQEALRDGKLEDGCVSFTCICGVLNQSKAPRRNHLNEQAEGDGQEQISDVHQRELFVRALAHAKRQGDGPDGPGALASEVANECHDDAVSGGTRKLLTA